MDWIRVRRTALQAFGAGLIATSVYAVGEMREATALSDVDWGAIADVGGLLGVVAVLTTAIAAGMNRAPA